MEMETMSNAEKYTDEDLGKIRAWSWATGDLPDFDPEDSDRWLATVDDLRAERDEANKRLVDLYGGACPGWAFSSDMDLRANAIRFRESAVAAEREAREAQAASAWWDLCASRGEWRRVLSDRDDETETFMCVRLPIGTDLSCKATREDAMLLAAEAEAKGGSDE